MSLLSVARTNAWEKKIRRYIDEEKKILLYGSEPFVLELLKYITKEDLIIGVGGDIKLDEEKRFKGYLYLDDKKIIKCGFDKIIIAGDGEAEDLLKSHLMDNLLIPMEKIVTLHTDSLFNAIEEIVIEANKYIHENEVKQKVKILWSPSFNCCPFFWMHDTIMATALKLRKAEIVPIICNGVQKVECTMWGGVWVASAVGKVGKVGMHDPFSDEYRKERDKLCNNCIENDYKVWADVFGKNPVKISDYLSKEEIEFAKKQIETLTENNWRTFSFNNIPIGKMAEFQIKNKYLLGYLKGNKAEFRSAKNWLLNCMLLTNAYDKILSDQNPDIVISHDTSSYMWAILCYLAERKNIPYYTYYMGTQGYGSLFYRKNGSVFDFDLTKAWKTWKQKPLTTNQNQKLDKYLSEMGKDNHLLLKRSEKFMDDIEINTFLQKIDLL